MIKCNDDDYDNDVGGDGDDDNLSIFIYFIIWLKSVAYLRNSTDADNSGMTMLMMITIENKRSG